jgi:hypothetical protein
VHFIKHYMPNYLHAHEKLEDLEFGCTFLGNEFITYRTCKERNSSAYLCPSFIYSRIFLSRRFGLSSLGVSIFNFYRSNLIFFVR